jgi:hypothetical protein
MPSFGGNVANKKAAGMNQSTRFFLGSRPSYQLPPAADQTCTEPNPLGDCAPIQTAL